MNSICDPKAMCRTMIGEGDISAEFKSHEDNGKFIVKYKSIDIPNVGKLTFFVDYLNRNCN